MGWFFGFKLHLIVNYRGKVIAAALTQGKVHDTKPVPELAKGQVNKLNGDKGYISTTLEEKLFNQGGSLITNIRRNMKAKALSL